MAVTIDGTNGITTNTGVLRANVYTVATLPTAGTSGRRAFVSNALTPTFGSVVVGGGAVTVPVYDNGTTWNVG
jgi:hypothetical protein